MQWLSHINEAPLALQQAMETADYPFLHPAFLQALQDTHCIGGRSGWQPHYLMAEPNSDAEKNTPWLLPAFIKHHSYGEYVFDWSWANAYHEHGFNYYPKLVMAAPFSPVSGPRLFSTHSPSPEQALFNQLTAIEQHCRETELSSAHLLFVDEPTHGLMKQSHWHQRQSVQFHWFNRGYNDFEDYLSHFKSRKRKAIKKERSELQRSGIQVEWLDSEQISNEVVGDFYSCYQNTYMKRGMQGYLSLAAFQALFTALPQITRLAVARDTEQKPLAYALYFTSQDTLYGRYWGCHQDIPGLHFELCYYQGIELCLREKLRCFNPGTQGEHKISRGFEPIRTYSYHWLAHPDFSRAVGDFVKQETHQVEHYHQECESLLPFNEDFMKAFRT